MLGVETDDIVSGDSERRIQNVQKKPLRSQYSGASSPIGLMLIDELLALGSRSDEGALLVLGNLHKFLAPECAKDTLVIVLGGGGTHGDDGLEDRSLLLID